LHEEEAANPESHCSFDGHRRSGRPDGDGVGVFRPRIIVALVLALLLLILVVQNTEVVSVRLLFWEFEMSRVILILLTSMTGFICGYVVARLTAVRAKAP
jgi:uncharacterized integral membrane protein